MNTASAIQNRTMRRLARGLIWLGLLVLAMSLMAPALGQTGSLTLWQTPDRSAVPTLRTPWGAPAIDSQGRVHGASRDAVWRLTPSSNAFDYWTHERDEVIESPQGAAVTSSGEVWYGSRNRRLNKLDPTTNTITTWDLAGGSDVFVFDTAPGSVWFVFDPPGSVSLAACRLEETTNTYQCWGVGATRDIDVDTAGNGWALAVSGQVYKIEATTGNVTRWIIPNRPPSDSSGAQIEVDSNGDIWALGRQNTFQHLDLDPTGDTITTYTCPTGCVPHGLAVESPSKIWYSQDANFFVNESRTIQGDRHVGFFVPSPTPTFTDYLTDSSACPNPSDGPAPFGITVRGSDVWVNHFGGGAGASCNAAHEFIGRVTTP